MLLFTLVWGLDVYADPVIVAESPRAIVGAVVVVDAILVILALVLTSCTLT